MEHLKVSPAVQKVEKCLRAGNCKTNGVTNKNTRPQKRKAAARTSEWVQPRRPFDNEGPSNTASCKNVVVVRATHIAATAATKVIFARVNRTVAYERGALPSCQRKIFYVLSDCIHISLPHL